ncbi:unnamed protein product, partial [Brassica rapa]
CLVRYWASQLLFLSAGRSFLCMLVSQRLYQKQTLMIHQRSQAVSFFFSSSLYFTIIMVYKMFILVIMVYKLYVKNYIV